MPPREHHELNPLAVLTLTQRRAEESRNVAQLRYDVRSKVSRVLGSPRSRGATAPFTNDQFRELSPYFEVFSKVSLTSSGIDDAGLYYIGQMTNVRELYLQKTKLDGSGIIFLQNLPNLEILNLSFTKVDDKAALDLLKIPNLRQVYLYRTNTSMQVIEALRKYKPTVRFLLEEGPYY